MNVAAELRLSGTRLVVCFLCTCSSMSRLTNCRPVIYLLTRYAARFGNGQVHVKAPLSQRFDRETPPLHRLCLASHQQQVARGGVNAGSLPTERMFGLLRSLLECVFKSDNNHSELVRGSPYTCLINYLTFSSGSSMPLGSDR